MFTRRRSESVAQPINVSNEVVWWPRSRIRVGEHAQRALSCRPNTVDPWWPATARSPKLGCMDIFSFLIPAALAAVPIVLAFGIYALYRGGDFGRSYSNKLMRLRIVTQAIAVAILVGALWWRSRS